ncbi:MAG: Rrf2 family transcriptional regulator [Bdellovibrionales bacterium]|nr:Rrf2 family transcriptional regulator [Bdellovibrionales bacterium]
MKPNKKIEYSVAALYYLGGRPGKTASVREISSACQIPEALLSKIMQRLKRVGVVHPIHGNQGGYKLAEDPSTFSLLQISDALSDRRPSVEFDSPAVSVLNRTVHQLLTSVSLESLITQPHL